MTRRLTNRKLFAVTAGISAPAVTKACNTFLSAALVGKRIDLDHPDVVAYLKKRETITTLDPLYDQSVTACIQENEFTGRFLRKTFSIGSERAKKLITTMEMNGIKKGSATTKRIENSKNSPVTKKSTPSNIDVGKIAEEQLIEIPENIEEFADMTLRELIEKFGTSTSFLDWLRATQMIENINERRLKNAVSSGTLVARDLVKQLVIDPINAAHIKLLTDGAKTITRRVTAMHGAGRDLVEIEKYVKGQITSFIRPIKNKFKRLTDA